MVNEIITSPRKGVSYRMASYLKNHELINNSMNQLISKGIKKKQMNEQMDEISNQACSILDSTHRLNENISNVIETNIQNSVDLQKRESNLSNCPKNYDFGLTIDIFRNSKGPKIRRPTVNNPNEIFKTDFGPLEYAEFDKLPVKKKEKLYFVAKLKPIISPKSTVVDYLARIDLLKVEKLMSLNSVFTSLHKLDNQNIQSKSKRLKTISEFEKTDKNNDKNKPNSNSNSTSLNLFKSNIQTTTSHLDKQTPVPSSRKNNQTLFFDLSLSAATSSNRPSSTANHRFEVTSAKVDDNEIDSEKKYEVKFKALPGLLSFLEDFRVKLIDLNRIYYDYNKNFGLTEPKLSCLTQIVSFLNLTRIFVEHNKNLEANYKEFCCIDPSKQNQLIQIMKAEKYIRRIMLTKIMILNKDNFNLSIKNYVRDIFNKRIKTTLNFTNLDFDLNDKKKNFIEHLNSINYNTTTDANVIDPNLIKKICVALLKHGICKLKYNVKVDCDQLFNKRKISIANKCRSLIAEKQSRLLVQFRTQQVVSDFMIKVNSEIRKTFINKLKANYHWRSQITIKNYNLIEGAQENITNDNFAAVVSKGHIQLNIDNIMSKNLREFFGLESTINKKIFGGTELEINARKLPILNSNEIRVSIFNPDAYEEVLNRAPESEYRFEELKIIPLTPIPHDTIIH